MEYFVRNCVLHRSMQNKHSYLEHEMKYFFKALAKEQKKSGGHVNTPAFSSTHAGIRARCRCPSTIKDELGYKLGTGKKNCVLHRSMQNKHSYLEHEMKYFFKALAKEMFVDVGNMGHLQE